MKTRALILMLATFVATYAYGYKELSGECAKPRHYTYGEGAVGGIIWCKLMAGGMTETRSSDGHFLTSSALVRFPGRDYVEWGISFQIPAWAARVWLFCDEEHDASLFQSCPAVRYCTEGNIDWPNVVTVDVRVGEIRDVKIRPRAERCAGSTVQTAVGNQPLAARVEVGLAEPGNVIPVRVTGLKAGTYTFPISITVTSL